MMGVGLITVVLHACFLSICVARVCWEILWENLSYPDQLPMIVVDPQQKKGNCWISCPLHSSVYDIQYGSTYSLPYQWRADYPCSHSQLTFYTVFSMQCEQEVSDDNYIPIIPCNILQVIIPLPLPLPLPLRLPHQHPVMQYLESMSRWEMFRIHVPSAHICLFNH